MMNIVYYSTAVPIWIEVIYHAMRDAVSLNDAVRAAGERAITAVGLHVSRGAMIWETYREFESMVLAGLQPAPGAVASADALKEIAAQTARVAALFKRQLAQPLLSE